MTAPDRKLEFDTRLRHRFEAAAAAGLPDESLALLLGRFEGEDCRLLDLIVVANRAASPQDSFRLAATDWRRVRRAAAARELDIVGVVHSHPRGPAELSPNDLAAQSALFPEVLGWPMLLCARDEAGAWGWRAWRWREGAIEPWDLEPA